MAHLVDYIDFSQKSFQGTISADCTSPMHVISQLTSIVGCALFILFNPLFWK